jgi:hypothetical protein
MAAVLSIKPANRGKKPGPGSESEPTPYLTEPTEKKPPTPNQIRQAIFSSHLILLGNPFFFEERLIVIVLFLDVLGVFLPR